MKTLIVEDDPTARAFLHGLLSHYGDCHISVSAEEAVEAVRESALAGLRFDLVCMDIRLPGLDGIEAVRQIRRIEVEYGILSTNGVKILMTTATDHPANVVRSFSALCDAYLVKPIKAAEFITELRGLGLLD